MANTSDKKLSNIPKFGDCAILSKVTGIPTKCVYELDEWESVKTDVNISGKRALLKSSSLTCIPVKGDKINVGTIKPVK